ncbi:unnamed protein product [Larinioides sclopetarius]|uniref:Uncharacterized protein n=1 Tax=Larinioides sclopetarius TaxID=280406 RepID=A0AAV2A384_9ARAC
MKVIEFEMISATAIIKLINWCARDLDSSPLFVGSCECLINPSTGLAMRSKDVLNTICMKWTPENRHEIL